MFHVPVVNPKNEPLMPTTILRARRWVRSGNATPFWKKGIFCVRLNVVTEENKQTVALGIDPGSKKEAYTVKSCAHTYVNIQADAVTWVKKAIETRGDARRARRARRYRKTPCRVNRLNRRCGGLPPSTRARWQWKLRLVTWLKGMFPITDVVVEDVCAESKGKRNWDLSFSPLQVGKHWFYGQLSCVTKKGYETKSLRERFGLAKSKKRLSNEFEAHCVDSWALANSIVQGALDNVHIILVRPLRLHRRQLHVFVPTADSKRKSYGGTRSIGLKRGSLVRHARLGVVYVGGASKGRISLHDLEGSRLGQSFKVEDCRFLTYTSWICKP